MSFAAPVAETHAALTEPGDPPHMPDASEWSRQPAFRPAQGMCDDRLAGARAVWLWRVHFGHRPLRLSWRRLRSLTAGHWRRARPWPGSSERLGLYLFVMRVLLTRERVARSVVGSLVEDS